MSEKVRALSLTTGNVLTALSASSTSVTPSTTGNTLIGAPTLISSTFNANCPIQLLATPTNSATATVVDASATKESQHHQHHHHHHQQHAEVDTESSTEIAPGTIMAQLKFHLLPAETLTNAATNSNDVGIGNSIMNTSQISATSSESGTVGGGAVGVAALLSPDVNEALAITKSVTSATATTTAPSAANGLGGKHLKAQSVAGKTCRFPKLEECAHFHYERVQLGPLSVRLLDDKSELLTSSIASQSIGGDIAQHGSNSLNINISNTGPASFRSFSPTNCWFIVKVFPHQGESFLVKRSFENMQMFDEMLHRCVYDRKISGLKDLEELEFKSEEDVEYAVARYLERFSKIASDSLTCGTILTWLQLDNKGRRLPLADSDTMRTINTPAVGAAYGVRRYQAQASDEISIEVGDMISVIDMPSPAESIWWRGKKSHLQKPIYEVGFFPQSCVATIGDKVPRNFPMPAPLVGQLDVSPTKPVLRKHGKLIAFFRSFILSRPSRRRLKQSGIYRERVFSCDLSEHLLNSGQEIPMVLKCCAEFIEQYGIVDGIYRLSGITSNIQRLRRAFDEERVPDLGNPEMKQDIHAVSSLLKMYFRELPNPLCTYQLYDNFVEAIQEKSESTERLRLMKETVLKLPPPHYRTLKYLSEHLNKISQHAARTNMTDKNLAIVWAPNLLRSPALESGGVAALRGVGVQAVVTEYLIRNCHNIFDALDDPNARLSYIATVAPPQILSNNELRMDSLTDCESLLVEQREHDQSLSFVERPKSLSAGGPKLISLEEAQERQSRLESSDLKQSMPMAMVASNAANIGSYIEVGGGPSSLPDKYHTVLDPPRNWQKRKTHSWKSIFTRSQRPVSTGNQDLKAGVISTPRKSSTSGVAQVTFADTDSIINSVGGACKHNINSKQKISGGKSMLSKQEKPKSIDLFETSREGISKPMEICVRSNSIDSLRTAAGHSRSVSHDSYFDILQSPQRGNMTTCPSRELSELGINFDREEPEMRIFSESESLVSSPRVGKENMPPSSAVASRRILRARPEDFSSQTNSVNPSPKKQPRLNLLLSPSAASARGHNWARSNASSTDNVNATGAVGVSVSGGVGVGEGGAGSGGSSDESCCKRYKLEDQLSDIQFIDCGTPEHTVAGGIVGAITNQQQQAEAAATLFTNAQVHAAPKSSSKSSSLHGSTENTKKIRDSSFTTQQQQPQHQQLHGKSTEKSASTSNTRYSYPTVQLGSKRKEQEATTAAVGHKERFSYPSASAHDATVVNHMQVEENYGTTRITQYPRTCYLGPPPPKPPHLPKSQQQNRNSYCNANDTLSVSSLLTAGSDTSKDSKCNEMERSKHSMASSSPMHSPRYSLLTSETSSEHSSAVNTPQYDLEPLMISSAMSGLSGISATQQQQQQFLLGVEAPSLGTSHESLGSNISSQAMLSMGDDKRDMHALKRELSLDLKLNAPSKTGYEQLDAHSMMMSGSQKLPTSQLQLVPSPSNNSNFTDNTSQSVTPSEYGYQNLQRQSSMHSLLATSDNSPTTTYDDYENTPSNLISPLGSLGNSVTHKLPSPIKSTISITYNRKSPKLDDEEADEADTEQPDSDEKTLLETSFDENTVYEQLRFFRNSVTEVNQMLNDAEPKLMQTMQEINEEEIVESENDMQELLPAHRRSPADVEMRESLNHKFNHANIDDDEEQDEKLLYENVELRKPKSVYANLLGEDMRANNVEIPNDLVSLDSLNATTTTETSTLQAKATDATSPTITTRRSPSNFSVKELATKFETSPVDLQPAFDFSLRNSMKKSPQHYTNDLKEKPPSPRIASMPAQIKLQQQPHQHQQNKQKLPKNQQQQLQITRSLDENAFIREFGSAKHLHQDAAATRSTQQLPEIATTAATNRRKSFDFTRPKTLNPPKRLPGMSIAEEICMTKRNEMKPIQQQQREQQKECNYNDSIDSCSLNETSSIEHDFESTELKITPTTENRISLIQQNVGNANSAGGDSNLNHQSGGGGSNLLSGVKLDRERIDRIKEERRQQLLQKYGATDAFKSKSKIDLHSSSTKDDSSVDKITIESLRLKSKSRGDVRDNLKDMAQFTNNKIASAGSESTLNAKIVANTILTPPPATIQQQQQRIRSISDERNQNCVSQTTATTTMTSNLPPKKATTTAITTSMPQKEEFSTRATALKFERKNLDLTNGVGSAGVASVGIIGVGKNDNRERRNDTGNATLSSSRNNLASTREKISPQFSIRDVTAMFESRAQNQ